VRSTPAPGSVCLLRLSALGDVCHCIATVRAVQRQWPETRLTWIIGTSEYRLVRDLPGVEFIVYDKRAGLGALLELRKRLRRRFDVLLHGQVSLRANLIASLVRADRRIGFDAARAREGHGLVVNERIPVAPFQHQAEALLSFAEVLGADTDGVDRAPPIGKQDREFAVDHQPEPGRAVLISPCSSRATRNWSVANYAEVADWVIEKTGRPMILVGGLSETEQRAGEAIESAMRRRPVNLIGKDTLGQSLAMLERAACLIAPDSGPVHFAAALGTPVVGLYASTWSRRSGPLGSLEHCVDRFPEACGKYLGRAPEDVKWGKRIEKPGVMGLIEPEMVIARLKLVLGENV